MKKLYNFLFTKKIPEKMVFVDSSGREYSVYSINLNKNIMKVTYDGKDFVSFPILFHLNDSYLRTLSDSENFQLHLCMSSKIVKSWPRWKQGALGGGLV